MTRLAALALLALLLAAPRSGSEAPSTAPILSGAPLRDLRLVLETGDVVGSGVPLPGFRAQPGTGHAQAQPSGSSGVGTALLGGWASWFDVGPGHYAAAGPLLRDGLGDWRGKVIRVTSGDKAVLVTLTDWCACRERHGKPTILDLSRDAFAILADPSLGIVAVEIELVALPNTDTGP